jgi:flagellar protein FliO/FliZ
MNAVFLAARRADAVFAFISILFVTPVFAVDQVAQPAIVASGFASMLQVLFGLGLVLAAIAGTAWLLKKLAPGQVAGSGAVRVVGGVAVGPKERVVLVDVGETRLVLGVAPGHVSTLLEMPRPINERDIAGPEGNGGKFYARLRAAMNPHLRSANTESEPHETH